MEYKASAERLISHPSSSSGPTVDEILGPGLDLIHDLAEAALSLNSTGNLASKKTAFNDLINITSHPNIVIASCLYLTVKLQLTELMLSMIITAEEHSEAGDELRSLTEHGSENVRQICEKISAIFVDGHPGVEQYQGWPFRAWCMLWPMAAIMNSCLAGEETRGWVKSKLCHVGKLTGFGLMTIIASM